VGGKTKATWQLIDDRQQLPSLKCKQTDKWIVNELLSMVRKDQKQKQKTRKQENKNLLICSQTKLFWPEAKCFKL